VVDDEPLLTRLLVDGGCDALDQLGPILREGALATTPLPNVDPEIAIVLGRLPQPDQITPVLLPEPVCLSEAARCIEDECRGQILGEMLVQVDKHQAVSAVAPEGDLLAQNLPEACGRLKLFIGGARQEAETRADI
jgi:hypothetical protein